MIDLINTPSGQTYQLVGTINATSATPTIKITGDDPTLDIGGTLPSELILHITPEIDTNGKSKSEAFYVNTPIDNGDGTYSYTTVYRALKNNVSNNPPQASDSLGSGGYKLHTDGAAVVISPTVELRNLKSIFNNNVANRATQVFCFDYDTDVTVGDNRAFILIPDKYDGDVTTRIYAKLLQAGTGATATTIEVDKNGTTQATLVIAGGSTSDEDLTVFTVAKNDLLSVNITTATETPAKGLILLIEFNG